MLICAAQNSCSWHSFQTHTTTGAGLFGLFARNKAKFLQEKGNTESIFFMLVCEAANTACGVLQTHCRDLFHYSRKPFRLVPQRSDKTV